MSRSIPPSRALILPCVFVALLAAGEDQPPPILLPPPSADQLAPSIKGLRLTFKADYANRESEARRALIQRLIDIGSTSEQPSERYAALREAVDQAGRLGDTALIDQALTVLASGFAVNLPAERLAAYAAAVPVAPVETTAQLTEATFALVDAAMTTDDYRFALTAALQAEAMARRQRDPGYANRAKALLPRLKELAEEWERIGPLEDLLGEPDPAAARRLARFRCLFKGEWSAALPHLADHEDASLQSAARAELSAQTAEQRLAAAVLWGEFGKRSRGLAREGSLGHAVSLLHQAIPECAPPQRAQAEKRLGEFARLLGISARVPPIPPGAVLYLTCERDSIAEIAGRMTVQDLSGNGFHGRLAGAKPATGAYGGALSFTTPEDVIDLGSVPVSRLAGSLSVAMWLRPTQFGARRNPINISYEGVGTITLEPNGRLNYFYAGDGPYQTIGSQFSLTLDAWTHIAVVRDGGARTVTWYLNGSPAGTMEARFAAARTTPDPILIGRGYAGPYLGLIDEIGLWGRALTANEIAALVGATKLGR